MNPFTYEYESYYLNFNEFLLVALIIKTDHRVNVSTITFHLCR